MLSKLFSKIKDTKLGKLITTPRELFLFFLLFFFVIAFIIAVLPTGKNKVVSGHDHNEISSKKESITWTCSMHPQIQLPKAGKCPICFMDLIPLKNDEGVELSDSEIRLSDTARKLAKINTIKAKKDFVTREIILSGRVEIDETKKGTVTARFPGRIEKMYINYTGVEIKKGEHLYKIYSPEIFQVQESLITSLKNLGIARKNENTSLIRAAKASYNAAKERLRLFGFTTSQIKSIEKTSKATETIDVFSPYNGTVMTMGMKEGDYMKKGSVIYNISDLSSVWVTFDAYEKDIRWLKYGEKVEITFEAYEGKTHQARIAYIDPVLNETTRTVTIRVNLDNQNLNLKPGMFAKAKITSILTDEGKFIDDSLTGKYISVMHPEIIKDKPGNCPICGMALVKASELGYTSSSKAKSKKILIPATAPLFTGTRSIVYIEHQRNGEYIYEGREITLGPKSGGFYVVEEGIKENEKVVINGVFKIDSAMQIVAKKSMMNLPVVDEATKAHVDNIDILTDLYISGVEKLADDDVEKAKDYFIKYKKELEKLDINKLSDEKKNTLTSLKHVHQVTDLSTLRNMLKEITENSINLFKQVHNISKDINLFYCPMADDNNGAFWLDKRSNVNNPYYGDAMLLCGENRGALIKQFFDK